MYLRYTWPCITWSLIVLILTLIPGKAIPDVRVFQIDKLVHFFIFGMLMVLSSYGLKKLSVIRGRPAHPIFIAALYSLSFGLMIEVLQQFVPGRNFSMADVLANGIGVAIGYFIFSWLAPRI